MLTFPSASEEGGGSGGGNGGDNGGELITQPTPTPETTPSGETPSGETPLGEVPQVDFMTVGAISLVVIVLGSIAYSEQNKKGKNGWHKKKKLTGKWPKKKGKDWV